MTARTSADWELASQLNQDQLDRDGAAYNRANRRRCACCEITIDHHHKGNAHYG